MHFCTVVDIFCSVNQRSETSPQLNKQYNYRIKQAPQGTYRCWLYQSVHVLCDLGEMSTPAKNEEVAFAEAKFELIRAIATAKTETELMVAVQGFAVGRLASVVSQLACKEAEQPKKKTEDVTEEEFLEKLGTTEPEVKKVADPTVHPVVGKLKDAAEDKELIKRLEKEKALLWMSTGIEYPLNRRLVWLIDPAIKNKKMDTLPTHYVDKTWLARQGFSCYGTGPESRTDRHFVVHRMSATKEDCRACLPEDYVIPPTNKDE